MRASANRERIEAQVEDIDARVAAIDWRDVSGSLGNSGWASLGRLLTASECAEPQWSLRRRRTISQHRRHGTARFRQR